MRSASCSLRVSFNTTTPSPSSRATAPSLSTLALYSYQRQFSISSTKNLSATQPSMASKIVTDNIAAANTARAKLEESSLEARSRKAANFTDVEAKLGQGIEKSEISVIGKITSLLRSKNPFGKPAKPGQHEVWLLDNTAYYGAGTQDKWEAEFVACFFVLGRKEITSHVTKIADLIGLDGKTGSDAEVRKRIAQRIQPFIWDIAPAKTVDITIPSPDKGGSPRQILLGPSSGDGISSQIMPTGGNHDANGATVVCTSSLFPKIRAKTHFAAPDGWCVISDIDDTIKITQTSSPIGTLKTTFADIPQTTPGLPQFYKILDEQFTKPAWFYLSASPYNLYPFIHKFITDHYHPGTIILRDASWQYFSGFLQSFTEGVQAYKVDRMRKINTWLPKRKLICIGDSTQSDPEAYAQIYKEFPGWIKAIYIRKVVDTPHMEEKNKEERFKTAFKDVPDHVWKVFVMPDELADHVKHLAGEAHLGIVGGLQAYFCSQEQGIKKEAKSAQPPVPEAQPQSPLPLSSS